MLAANTAYADFPRLASIVARDRFLPRQFMNQGDRLAFSNGIIILSVLAGVLLVVFGGDTHSLIPLYMIGVFVSFTLVAGRHGGALAAVADAGLAHQRGDQRLRRGRHRRRAAHRRDRPRPFEGAWIVLVMIPALVVVFEVTRRHYDHVAAELTLRDWQPEPAGHHTRARADRRHPARGRQGAAVRADAVAGRARRLRGHRSGGHRRHCDSSGRSGARASSWSSCRRRTGR